MEIIGIASLIALAVKIVDFLKYLRAGDWNAVTTQAATWIAGVLVVLLAASADITQGIDIGGTALGAMNTWSLIFVGLSLLSLGSVAYDFKKAVDGRDTAKTPTLLEGTRP